MDPGMIIFGAISAAAAGASAIIAWVSRADTIAAADRATKAEEAALSAWRDSAAALKEANDLAVVQHEERIARERLIRRLDVAQALRRWHTEKVLRTALGQETRPAHHMEKRELSTRLGATGEPGAFMLDTAIHDATQEVTAGDVKSALLATAAITSLTQAWIEDPEQFSAAQRAAATEDSLLAKLQEAADGLEEAISRAGTSHRDEAPHSESGA